MINYATDWWITILLICTTISRRHTIHEEESVHLCLNLGKDTKNSLQGYFIYFYSPMLIFFPRQKLLCIRQFESYNDQNKFWTDVKTIRLNWFLNNTTRSWYVFSDDFLSQNKPNLLQDIRKRFVFLVYLSGTLSLETISLKFLLQWFHPFVCFHLSSFHSLFSLNITFTLHYIRLLILYIFNHDHIHFILFQFVLKSSMWHFYLYLHLFYSIKVKAVWIAMLSLFASD